MWSRRIGIFLEIEKVKMYNESASIRGWSRRETTFDCKLNIICADALEWKPPKGTRYNAVWHDIWDNICGDNLDDMKKLHRKYGRRTNWQGSWCRDQCER